MPLTGVGVQVPLRTLLLTSRYPADQRKRGFQSVGYRAISSSSARHNVAYSLQPASRLRVHVRIRALAAQEPVRHFLDFLAEATGIAGAIVGYWFGQVSSMRISSVEGGQSEGNS